MNKTIISCSIILIFIFQIASVSAITRSSCEEGLFPILTKYSFIGKVYCIQGDSCCSFPFGHSCWNCGEEFTLPKNEWIQTSRDVNVINQGSLGCNGRGPYIGTANGESWLNAGTYVFYRTEGYYGSSGYFTVSYCLATHNDCTHAYCGINGQTAGWNKYDDSIWNDNRFLCKDGEWHSCNWELTDGWVEEHSTGQSVGAYTCVNGNSNGGIWWSYCGNGICELGESCNSCPADCPKTTFYRDADGDGYANSLSTTQACSAPAGYILARGDGKWDCDDSVTSCNVDCTTLKYADLDGDDYINATEKHRACDAPLKYITA